jgi:O-antigen ligase
VWVAAGLSTILIALLGRRRRVALLVFVLLLVGLPLALTRKPITANFEQTRLVLWTEAAPELLAEHPWGVGYTGTHGLLEKYTPRMREPQQHLHNNVVQIAVELGWLGMVVWLAWMATTFWVLLASYRALRAREPQTASIALGAFAAFCGLLTHGMVEYNFGDSEILMTFTFLMGLSAVLWQTRHQPQ